MDDIIMILLLSTCMFIGSYFAGMVPILFSMSESKVRSMTVIGAGLLIGTSLAVIIPEGINLLPKSHEHQHNHHETSAHNDEPSSKDSSMPATPVSTDEAHESGIETHSLIGICLISGFLFMLLVDHIGGSSFSRLVEGETLPSDQPRVTSSRHKITATLGLVVHAAADGIALGAAAATGAMHVEILVFAAIMLHKRSIGQYHHFDQAPAAFGLTSFLLHELFDRSRIRKHLVIFCLAAPVMTLLTYFSLSQSFRLMFSQLRATGVAMLFSGGTFLYVAAVHVLPEITGGGHDSTAKGLTCLELTLICAGALLPVLFAMGHKH